MHNNNNYDNIVCKIFGHKLQQWKYTKYYGSDDEKCVEVRRCTRCEFYNERRTIELHEWGEREFRGINISDEKCRNYVVKCKKCDLEKLRVTNHEWSDWSKQTECQYVSNCTICGRQKTKTEHTYKECKCIFCGNEKHQVEKCKCKECGLEIHAWDGCRCKECFKTRDEQHKWGSGGIYVCQCSRCFKTRHTWENCKCTRCGQEHDFENVDEHKHKCSICGLIESHDNEIRYSGYHSSTVWHCKKCLYSYTEEYNDW